MYRRTVHFAGVTEVVFGLRHCAEESESTMGFGWCVKDPTSMFRLKLGWGEVRPKLQPDNSSQLMSISLDTCIDMDQLSHEAVTNLTHFFRPIDELFRGPSS